MEDEMVLVSTGEIRRLRANTRLLYALEGAGVDNWEGYSVAMQELEDDEEAD